MYLLYFFAGALSSQKDNGAVYLCLPTINRRFFLCVNDINGIHIRYRLGGGVRFLVLGAAGIHLKR